MGGDPEDARQPSAAEKTPTQADGTGGQWKVLGIAKIIIRSTDTGRAKRTNLWVMSEMANSLLC